MPQSDLEVSQCYAPCQGDFKCVICKFVVQTPTECPKCDKLYCKPCIATWQQSSDTCPHCREATDFKAPSRVLQKVLSKVRYDCSSCGVQCRIGGRNAKHNSECARSVRVQCQACESTTIRGSVREIGQKIKEHLANECKRRQGFHCRDCKQVLTGA